MLSNKTLAWQQLQAHAAVMDKITLQELFNKDKQRFDKFSLSLDDILLDYSKQHINHTTIELLQNLAMECNLQPAIQALFNGEIINKTEQRAALHTQLRNPQTQLIEIDRTLRQMQELTTKIHNSHYTDIISIGIGGSDLGPRLVCEALAPYKMTSQRIHFVSNVDSDTLLPLLKKLDPKKTICLINSKTFTTLETLANAKIIQEWLQADMHKQTFAITANTDAAIKFGILPQHIFAFWEWVGGRYSVWSAVGLSIALSIGMENFKRFLHGAHKLDMHFLNTPLQRNLPVILGMLGVWQVNFRQYPTLCIAPYIDGLNLLPQYLQQLEMESNGKRVTSDGEVIPYQTVPVIWGGVGCNNQHAYMQMLHQGTQVVPVDFMVAKRSHQNDDKLQKYLIASCLGQSQALMQGKHSDKEYKDCPGNRPSTTIMFDKLTPEVMGKLLALYEHKVYVQGVLWQIQSFDQWGVQLGKELINDLVKLIENPNYTNIDSSTAGLLQNYLK